MIILGIDPGFAITGYGVLSYTGNNFKMIDYGTIETRADVPFDKRLLSLSVGLGELIDRYAPQEAAIEELFYNTNVKTAIKTSQGRGVSVLTCALKGLAVHEYTPLQVKQAVVGYGRASKQQVQQMVKAILCMSEIPRPDDAADALAIAICHAHSSKMLRYAEGGR
jgi:crossover junction endodeoxyribonuclease RuvC